MGWKDSVWEQRIKERINNQQDTEKVLDWAEKAWDLASGVASGLKKKNPFDMTGQYNTFKQSLWK